MSDDEFDELPATRPATQAEHERITRASDALFASLGAVPTSSRDDVRLLADALRDGRLSATKKSEALALGLTLGMTLAYELALEWVHVSASEHGRAELALQVPAGRSDVFEQATWFPISMVEKRVVDGTELDLLDLYDRGVRWVADVEGADADRVSSWGSFGDEVLSVLDGIAPGEALVRAGTEAMQVVLERLIQLAGGHAFVLDRAQEALALAPLARLDPATGEPAIPPVEHPSGRLAAVIEERVLFVAVLEHERCLIDARLASALVRRVLLSMARALGDDMPFERCSAEEREALLAPLRR